MEEKQNLCFAETTQSDQEHHDLGGREDRRTGRERYLSRDRRRTASLKRSRGTPLIAGGHGGPSRFSPLRSPPQQKPSVSPAADRRRCRYRRRREHLRGRDWKTAAVLTTSPTPRSDSDSPGGSDSPPFWLSGPPKRNSRRFVELRGHGPLIGSPFDPITLLKEFFPNHH